MTNLKDIKAIDTLVHPWYCDHEFAKRIFDCYEMQAMASTTFAGVAKRLGLKPSETWKVLAGLGRPSVEEMVQEMDETGVELVLIDSLIFWSWREHKEMGHYTSKDMNELVRKSGGRVVGGASYNPFRIKESIEEIERAVKHYNNKFVWFHPISFGLTPNDKKCYPLYLKCLELGIPVCIQVGHSAEPLPSQEGHPMYADEVARDFPDLTIVLTHTGWPWVEEWISMIWRQPNVYGSISAYYPSDLDPAIVRFMDGRGRSKVMWATNGLGLTRCKKEFLELPLREETKKAVLRENAIKVFNLEGRKQ